MMRVFLLLFFCATISCQSTNVISESEQREFNTFTKGKTGIIKLRGLEASFKASDVTVQGDSLFWRDIENVNHSTNTDSIIHLKYFSLRDGFINAGYGALIGIALGGVMIAGTSKKGLEKEGHTRADQVKALSVFAVLPFTVGGFFMGSFTVFIFTNHN